MLMLMLPLFNAAALSVYLLSCLIVKLFLHGQLQRIEFATCFPLNRWVTNFKQAKVLAQRPNVLQKPIKCPRAII